MASTIPPRQLQHGAKAQTSSFPYRQLFILGMFSLSSEESGSKPLSIQGLGSLLRHSASSLHSTNELTSKLSISLVSHLRANRLHVHLPLRLLHDHILQHHH